MIKIREPVIAKALIPKAMGAGNVSWTAIFAALYFFLAITSP
jgi:hypothetical protein